MIFLSSPPPFYYAVCITHTPLYAALTFHAGGVLALTSGGKLFRDSIYHRNGLFGLALDLALDDDADNPANWRPFHLGP